MKRSTSFLALTAASALLVGTVPAAPAWAQQSVNMDQFAGNNAELYRKLSFADLVESVSPAVVSIRTEREVEASETMGSLPPELERLLPGLRDRFGGMRPDGEPRRARGEGSGFFIDGAGHIVTNNHVVEGADSITVVLNNGEELTANLIGTDPETDIAVVRVEPSSKQRFVKFSPNADLRVGDYVLAVGNPFGLGGTVTSGIVSALGRESGPDIPYADFIQIDASINRGNSGGPTFDVRGNVIGVNTAIISPTGVNAGIGLAIPADVADGVVRQIIEYGQVSRGFLGVNVRNPREQELVAIGYENGTGAFVAEVTDGSPADQAGIRAGDLVVDVAGQDVESSTDLTRKIGGFAPGEKVRVTVFRDGKRRKFTVKLDRREPQRLAEISPNVLPERDDNVTEQLGVSFRKLDDNARRRLGIGQDVDGVLITDVTRGSEAETAEIRPGMVVVAADNKKVTSPSDIKDAVQAAKNRGRGAVLLRVQTRQGLDFRALPISN